MPASDFPSWYPQYRELRNRSDSGGQLTPTDQSALDDYETRLRLEADSLGKVGSQAQRVNDTIGDSTVASAVTPPPPANDLPPYDKQVRAILDEPGTKELGFTKKTLSGMGPVGVGELYSQMFPSGGSSGGSSGGGANDGVSDGPFDQSQPSGAGGPWALEVTTQARLVEIREAIGKLGNGKQVTGQEGEDDLEVDEKLSLRKILRGEALNALDLMSFPGASRNRSGQNLARYGQMMRGTGLRAAGKLGKIFGFSPSKVKRDEESNDQSIPKIDPKVVMGAIEGAEAGAAAGPSGAVAGAVAGASGGAAAGGGSGGAAVAGGEAAAAGGLAGAGAATAGLAVLAVAAFEAGKATYQFARTQEAEIRKLSEFGGQQSIGLAQLDAHRIGRDVKTAQETGDSSKSLTESIDKFEDKLQPIESLLTNIANIVGGRALDLIGQIIAPITVVVEIINRIYEALPDDWKKDQKEDELPFDRLRQLAEDTMRQNQARFPVGGPNNPRANGGFP